MMGGERSGVAGAIEACEMSALAVRMFCTLLLAETTTHFAGLDRKRTRSSRRIEEPRWAVVDVLRATVA
jgi:hypothetical protein